MLCLPGCKCSEYPFADRSVIGHAAEVFVEIVDVKEGKMSRQVLLPIRRTVGELANLSVARLLSWVLGLVFLPPFIQQIHSSFRF